MCIDITANMRPPTLIYCKYRVVWTFYIIRLFTSRHRMVHRDEERSVNGRNIEIWVLDRRKLFALETLEKRQQIDGLVAYRFKYAP